MTVFKRLSLLFILFTINVLAHASSPEPRGTCDKIESSKDGEPWQIFLKDETPSEIEKLPFTYRASSLDTNTTFSLESAVTLASGYQLKYRNGQTVTNLDEHIALYMELADGSVEEITTTPKPFTPMDPTTRYVSGKAFYKFKQDPSIYANGPLKVYGRWRITCQ